RRENHGHVDARRARGFRIATNSNLADCIIGRSRQSNKLTKNPAVPLTRCSGAAWLAPWRVGDLQSRSTSDGHFRDREEAGKSIQVDGDVYAFLVAHGMGPVSPHPTCCAKR